MATKSLNKPTAAQARAALTRKTYLPAAPAATSYSPAPDKNQARKKPAAMLPPATRRKAGPTSSALAAAVPAAAKPRKR